MTKFKIERQLDGMDSGPACLSMIAKHYGKEYSIDNLRRFCHISKEGVSLLGISEAAELIGFKTVGGRTTFEKLAKEASLLCIVYWKQEHFVVVYKIKQKKHFPKTSQSLHL